MKTNPKIGVVGLGGRVLSTLAAILAAGTGTAPLTSNGPAGSLPAAELRQAPRAVSNQRQQAPAPVASSAVRLPVGLIGAGDFITVRSAGRTPYECGRMHRKNVRKGWVRT